MANENPTFLPTAGDATIRCFAFQNPESINGPFGDFKLITPVSGNTTGHMIIHTLWGLGTTTKLFLWETSHEGNVYQFKATGYLTSPTQKPAFVETTVEVNAAANWANGTVSFDGAPEPEGGLPFTQTGC